MPEYIVSAKDIRDAENFLVKFQTEQVPTANLEKGGAVRDLLITGFAALYAFIRGEIDRVTARQSLLRIQSELTEDDDIAQAVDEILSNFFVFRKSGQFAHMTGRFHFLQSQAYSIPLASRFWRTNTTVFYIDADIDPYVVTEQQLFPVFDSSGTLVDYVVDIPLRSARTGEGYNLDPGKFVRADVPGGLPYFSHAENTEESSDGKDVESSDALITRAETAITVRNLINNRSNNTVLQEQFPSVIDTLTVGMGEVEMVRDRRHEIAQHLQVHFGGHYDTYLNLSLVQVEEIGLVGGFFVRPDNVSNVFRDPELTYDLGRTFLSVLGVQPGHVLHIHSGITGAPQGFLITRVTDHEIEVSTQTPFTEPSDEQGVNAVNYSIGWLSPGFGEVELEVGVFYRTASVSTSPTYTSVPYGTSRRIQQPGKIVLSGRPLQGVVWVEVTDPPAGSILVDPSTETLVFNNRINMQPAAQTEPQYTEYQIEVHNPLESQSMRGVQLVDVGYGSDPAVFDGLTLRVVYYTLESFPDVHRYVVDRNQRVACANQLVRGRHPVWLEILIPYKMKPTAGTNLDEQAAAETVAAMVNTFDSNDDLNTSDITLALREEYPDIGAVYDVELSYHLDGPDGQQVFYSTEDLVSIFPEDSNSVTWENEEDVTFPPEILASPPGGSMPTAEEKLRRWYLFLGVSDRTVHYRTLAELISFEARN